MTSGYQPKCRGKSEKSFKLGISRELRDWQWKRAPRRRLEVRSERGAVREGAIMEKARL